MGTSLFQILVNAIKSKIVPIISKLKMWTSWNFIRTRIIAVIRGFFSSLLDFKPRDKKDYFEVFGWLISKRLAFAAVVMIGVLSSYYLVRIRMSTISIGGDGIRTYGYNSIMLRFTEGKVKIKGKSGYLAYEGDVADGSVTGNGTLYNRDGGVVYQGSFVKNCYHGAGTSYYPDGTMEYSGQFENNLYQGSGTQYRENGSLLYEGSFDRGKREGTGSLYDNGNNLIYSGSFSRDQIVYSELLGKTSAEVAKCYNGSRELYENDTEFAVILKDIDAIYLGASDPESLDDEIRVDQVIVLKDSFPAGSGSTSSIKELRKYFGEERYQGNSGITMGEAVAVNYLDSQAGGNGWTVQMNVSSDYSDYGFVESFDTGFSVYMYSFYKDGLIYTFFSQDRNDRFSFYSVEKEEGGS